MKTDIHIQRILDIYDKDRKTDLEFDLMRLVSSAKGNDDESDKNNAKKGIKSYINDIDFIKGKIVGSLRDSIDLIMVSSDSDYNKALLIIAAARVLSGWHNISNIPADVWSSFSTILVMHRSPIILDEKQEKFKVI
ncbi:MAG: hypothetical protein PHX80_04400 [Candidatus Nanoarchaeia archaeon]|nr:hypothetical protein [Candidatus Nanoarchaeia archaeon]MDD5551256.1 hypothetical protein [Candidatus Omnitrophota bacterium]